MVARLGNTEQARLMFTEETYKQHLQDIEKLRGPRKALFSGGENEDA
jgi:hypothetical protein